MIHCQSQANPSNVEVGKSLWNGIWKLRFPNKVRHFIWQAVRNSLPTKLNLHRRQVVPKGLCDLCRDCPKDSVRALWYCDAVKAIWQFDLRFSFLRAQKFSMFEDLVQFLCSHGSSDLFAWFAMVAWSVWERRNRLRVGQKTGRVDEIA